MPAQLLALTDGPSILLDKPIMLLGRHAECDLQLNSRKVSRRHCCVAVVRDCLIVRDLGSTNGIRINGERVAEGKLKAGDELTIGNFRYQVCLDHIPGLPVAPAIQKNRNATVNDPVADSDVPVPIEEPAGLGRGVIPTATPAAKKQTILQADDSFILPEKLRIPPSGGQG